MEFQKIVNFLVTSSDDKDLPRFVTKKWIEVYDQSEENYNVNKEIRIKTSMLRSDLMLIKEIKILHLKIMRHLLIASQKLMV